MVRLLRVDENGNQQEVDIAIAQQNSYTNYWVYEKFTGVFNLSATTALGALRLFSTVSGTGASNTSDLANNSNEFGGIVASTGTTATGYAGLLSSTGTNSAQNIRLANSGGRTFLYELDVNFPLISTVTEVYGCVLGFANNVNAPTDGAYISMDTTGNLIGFTRNNSAQSVSGSIATIASGATRTNIKIELSTTRARFVVNDGTPVEMTTNLPLGRTFGYCASIVKGVGLTARTLRLYGMGVGDRP
ncbi:MAG: hypothetical protein ACRC62_15740 [Microcoleus sp.]